MNGVVLIRTRPGTSASVVSAVGKIEGTTACFAVFGRTDVIAFAKIENATRLARFASEAARIEGVTATETLAEAEVS